MKKIVPLLMLALIILAAGCANDAPDANLVQENTATEQNNTVINKAISR